MANFRYVIAFALLATVATFVPADALFGAKTKDVTKLQIGVKFKPEKCTVKAKSGDEIKVHYTGRLTDGTIFDSSIERKTPISFTLGQRQVIDGWDSGINGMCVGEKRKLKIPSHMGYGDQGSPPTIPGGATLIFETELVAINGDKTQN
mmetsp:Transcript_1512/g.2611  ORF Transcript_1512/g.2611 Transcript_1512/m.2611 type:complete len:149 (-) Transcript_1512:133-579(-)